ncbi:MAG TPA: hypothetical protein PLJ78_00840 [Anaerolineae bacterium]|nr:hypothetical protein [Anaerolineae bacterium]HQK12469.1 hypothetical protein [Anaerolineae bacterium]
MTVQTVESENKPKGRNTVGRLWNAFKNIAIIFSFIVNFVLVLVLLLSPGPVFMAKSQVAEPLLLDLDSAFASLGKTVIRSTVYITDTMPVVFDLPLAQNTQVVLVAPVPLQAPATFVLPGGGGAINGTVQLALPQGMALPVALNLMVPVSTTVPVIMQVPVEIPLAEAGMAPAIEQLRAVFWPITGALQSLPDTPEEFIQQATQNKK